MDFELQSNWQGVKGGQKPSLQECFSYSPKFSSANVAGLSRLSDEAILMVINVPRTLLCLKLTLPERLCDIWL